MLKAIWNFYKFVYRLLLLSLVLLLWLIIQAPRHSGQAQILYQNFHQHPTCVNTWLSFCSLLFLWIVPPSPPALPVCVDQLLPALVPSTMERAEEVRPGTPNGSSALSLTNHNEFRLEPSLVLYPHTSLPVFQWPQASHSTHCAVISHLMLKIPLTGGI